MQQRWLLLALLYLSSQGIVTLEEPNTKNNEPLYLYFTK
jgi:hypothetical protein